MARRLLWPELGAAVATSQLLDPVRLGETRQVLDKALSARLDEAVVDQSRINLLASEINKICRTATLDLAYRVGELVIGELYGGSTDRWARQGTRSISYRKLAHRADLLMSPSALCRAVAVYTLCEKIGGRAAWQHLTASHLQEVLPLPPAQQERLLKVAEAERWPVARLRAEVSKRRPSRRRSGRSRLKKVMSLLKACQRAVNDEILFDVERGAADELAELLTDVQRRIGAIQSALAAPRDAAVCASETRLKCPTAKR